MNDAVERVPFALSGAAGETIRADLRIAANASGRLPVAVFCHGFKGFKDWGGWPWACERLALSGFASIAFNFSHNGIGEEPDRFARPDLFAKDTWSKQMEDLGRVLDAIAAGRTPRSVRLDARRIGVLGHSRGGAVAILVAADDSRVRAVVGLAPTVRIDPFPPDARERARRAGFYPVVNSRTGEILPVGLAAFEDIDAKGERLSVTAAAGRLRIPLLVVHGDADEAVPLAEGSAIVSAAPPGRARLAVVPGGSHTFGTAHPFREPTSFVERAIEESVAFLRESL